MCMSKFAPLHIISCYSFLKSGLTVKKIARSIEKQGYFGAGIADFGSMYGIPEFVHAMEDIKKPYLVGINITIDETNLCLYVLNEEGYHHLININTAIQKTN